MHVHAVIMFVHEQNMNTCEPEHNARCSNVRRIHYDKEWQEVGFSVHIYRVLEEVEVQNNCKNTSSRIRCLMQ